MAAPLRRSPAIPAPLALLLCAATVWAAGLARLARSVRANAAHWSEPRGEAGGLLYVALGDSAAQGIGASSPDRGYVGVLAGRLRAATGRPVQVVNLSASGAHLDDVIDVQLPALEELGRTPDVVTVAVGGNDVRGYDRSTFAAGIERLTSALPAGTYLADVPYFMHGRWQRDAEEGAGLLRTAAAARHLRPVALHEAQRAQGWQAMFTHFAADWFHPNDRGHRVWADAFWAEIRPDLDEIAGHR